MKERQHSFNFDGVSEWMMVQWAVQSQLPLHLLLTKADKLKRGAAKNTLLAVKKELKDLAEVSVQLFSINQPETIQALPWSEDARAVLSELRGAALK